MIHGDFMANTNAHEEKHIKEKEHEKAKKITPKHLKQDKPYKNYMAYVFAVVIIIGIAYYYYAIGGAHQSRGEVNLNNGLSIYNQAFSSLFGNKTVSLFYQGHINITSGPGASSHPLSLIYIQNRSASITNLLVGVNSTYTLDSTFYHMSNGTNYSCISTNLPSYNATTNSIVYKHGNLCIVANSSVQSLGDVVSKYIKDAKFSGISIKGASVNNVSCEDAQGLFKTSYYFDSINTTIDGKFSTCISKSNFVPLSFNVSIPSESIVYTNGTKDIAGANAIVSGMLVNMSNAIAPGELNHLPPNTTIE